MESVTIETMAAVEGQPGYEVVQGGVYALLDLVPCRRITADNNGPTCAFLAATVVNLSTEEIT